MSTNEHEGPLSRLMRGLGLDADLAPIAAVKRIDERPVSLNPELLFTQIPEQMSDTGIHALELYKEGPSLPETVPDRFLSTKKRHLPDIYECRNCNYQFPQEATCPSCNSSNIFLFMRAPSRGEVRRHRASEEALTELDPDWRERFNGDADLAWEFYQPKPRASRVIHSSPFEPPTHADDLTRNHDYDDVDFDSGLTDDDAR